MTSWVTVAQRLSASQILARWRCSFWANQRGRPPYSGNLASAPSSHIFIQCVHWDACLHKSNPVLVWSKLHTSEAAGKTNTVKLGTKWPERGRCSVIPWRGPPCGSCSGGGRVNGKISAAKRYG